MIIFKKINQIRLKNHFINNFSLKQCYHNTFPFRVVFEFFATAVHGFDVNSPFSRALYSLVSRHFIEVDFNISAL